MNNKTTANWLLVFLMMAVSAAGALMLVLKTATTFWFQTLLQSSQLLAG